MLLSNCKMTGLFSSRVRISLLVLSGDKKSCMLPINMSWAHCISWYGTEVWYGVVWNKTSYYTIYHTIPLTSTCTIYYTVLLIL